MQKQIAQFKAEMRQIGDEMRSMDNERDAKIAQDGAARPKNTMNDAARITRP